jgi:hypothetical protein
MEKTPDDTAAPASSPGMFWEDHARDMLDPVYRREYMRRRFLLWLLPARRAKIEWNEP